MNTCARLQRSPECARRRGATFSAHARPTLRAVDTDVEMVARLRNGDEEAFVAWWAAISSPCCAWPGASSPVRPVAEEAVQDTWLGLVRGIETFEGRSSFKTWLFRILVNRARSAGTKEHPAAPTEALHAVDPSRFNAQGQWADPVDRWIEESEQRLDAAAWSPILKSALQDLPPRQRQVVLLRDVEGTVARRGLRRAGHQRGQPAGAACTGAAPSCAGSSRPKWGKGKPCCHCAVGHRVPAGGRAGHGLPRGTPSRAATGAASRRHLRACPNCTAYLEQIRITIALTGAVETDDLTPEAREDLSALYRRWRAG
jgi:RNA polymerase sigma-70 factor (ECF subfamily)